MTEILAYHSISNNSQDFWAVSPSTFESEMQWLAERGYTGISLKEFYKNIKREKVFVLTFDDGYKDFFDTAMPILDKLNFSATIFIVPKLIGGVARWRKGELQSVALLNWDEVHSALNVGHEIGSHGLSHLNLSGLSRGILEEEIVGSKDLIEENIKSPVVSFAYPFNIYTEQVIDIVKEADYKCAVRCGENCNNDFKVDYFLLCRRSINSKNSVKDFIE